MAETTTNAEQKLPGWFSSSCDRLWRAQRVFWTLFGVGVLASLLAFLLTLQWPFMSNKSLDGTFLGWCFQNSWLLLFIGLFYLACFGVVYIGHRYHRLVLSMPTTTTITAPERLREEPQHEESLVILAKGVQRTLDELPLKTVTPTSTPSAVEATKQEIPPPPQNMWNVPYRRNPFFTGREDILKQIYERFFASTTSVRSQALSGLGGIGKTQIALEYAYRFHQEYNAVFWVHSENREILISDFVDIARKLNLSEKDEQEQLITIQSVQKWLRTHSKWLLIFDNADELEMIKEFIPHAPLSSHILLTTRSQAMGGLARQVEVRELSTDAGALLLLRRANLLDEGTLLEQINDTEREPALKISHELGGLPLAIDQAGAYIEEAQCTLQSYLNIYRTHRIDLLKERGMTSDDHPEPVATTWSLSFAKIEQTTPAAADLLRACSFLHPDSIPEEILMKGGMYLGPSLAAIGNNLLTFNKAIAALLSYSLIRRNNTEKTISVHHLVQAVVRDSMDQQYNRIWNVRILRMLINSFPKREASPWLLSEQLLPHILGYIDAIWKSGEIWPDILPELPFLIEDVAAYLSVRVRYTEAEPLYLMIAYIWEQMLGQDNPLLASAFSRLATLYKDEGKIEDAEIFFNRALLIWEKELESPEKESVKSEIAFTLNGAANLYRRQERYEEAALFYEQAYLYLEQVPEIKPVDKLYPLVGLASLYMLQNKFEEAEETYLQLIDVYEHESDVDDADLAHALAGLAMLYQTQNRFEDAEKLNLTSLRIREKILGTDHPQIATILNNLANLYYTLGEHEKAEPLYLRAIDIYQHIYGPEHLQVSLTLFGLARSYYQQNKYEEAERLFLQSLSIQEKSLGGEHPNLVFPLVLLSDLYKKQEKYNESKLLEARYRNIIQKNHQE